MHDLVIVGTGAAGFSSAVYAARSKIDTMMIGAHAGGTCSMAYEIENYLGFEKIRGNELAKKFKEHAESYDVPMKTDMVTSIKKEGDVFKLETMSSEKYEAKSVIIATGSKHRKLGLPSEKRFFGRGVSYCATCDGFFFKDKTVAIVGGGDSAITAAIFLGEICEKVYMIIRKNFTRCEAFWLEKLKTYKNVEFLYETEVEEFLGEEKLEGVKLSTGNDLKVDGVFVLVGFEPENALAKELGAEIDKDGFIKVDKGMETTVPGVFSAGDVSDGSNHFHQVATAVAEGAIASNSVFLYLKKSCDDIL